MNAPFPYYGGKHYMLKHLLPLVPDHFTYVEVFGGSATLLLNKPMAKVEVYNDIDGVLVEFFRTIQDPEKLEQFVDKLYYLPSSRKLFEQYQAEWKECEGLEKLWRWYYLVCFGFNGLPHNGYRTHRNRNHSRQLFDKLNNLGDVCNRFLNATVECLSWEKLIPMYDTSRTFLYLDPPYVLSTRGGKAYSNEMTDEQHHNLVDMIKGVKGKVLLSGYPNLIYDRLGWDSVEHNTQFRLGGRLAGLAPRIEKLWYNYQLDPHKDLRFG